MLTKLSPPLILLLPLAGLCDSFAIQPKCVCAQTSLSLFSNDGGGLQQSRRRMFEAVAATVPAVLVAGAYPALADVSDGNALPQAAQHFARIVKLKTDLKAVKNRATTAGEGEIDQKEWDNISKFLRTVYSTAENDMKAIGKGVFNPENQKQALADVELIKKYAKAGDVSVGKKDGLGLAPVIGKIGELVDDFLEALSDVPDEI